MSRTSDHVKALSQTELLSGLTETDLIRVAATAAESQFAPGVTIVAEGATDGDFYVILEGTARVEVGGEPEDELGPGDYFGEISLIDGEPRAASVIAATDVRALSIGRWGFRSLLRDNPDMAEALLVEMARRIRLARTSRTL